MDIQNWNNSGIRERAKKNESPRNFPAAELKKLEQCLKQRASFIKESVKTNSTMLSK